MSSAGKGQAKGNDKGKDKDKEKEKNSKLPSVNAGKAGAANTNTPSKKGNETTKTPSKVEKLPSIKPNSTEEPKSSARDSAPVQSASSVEVTSDQNANVTTEPPTAAVETAAKVEISPVPAASANPEPVLAPVETPAPVPKPPQNGKVTLIYEQYNEQFDIVNGSTTAENIDEVYCLTFVMPGCLIHLSKMNPQEKRQAEIEGNLDLFFEENPRGTYHGLEVDQTYYVYVEQEAEQLARDQARMKQIVGSMDGAKPKGDGQLTKDDGRVMESCSCIYGNPCVDEYGCKDWGNRFAIATKNGWKGF